MAINNPYQTYQQNKATTSSPGELTLMLYNGCLKFIKQGQLAMQQGNIEERHRNLLKAQDIIRELMVTLKTDSELGKNMMSLYDFILNQLIEGNVENNLEKVQTAEDFVVSFRDAWKEAIVAERKIRYGENKNDLG